MRLGAGCGAALAHHERGREVDAAEGQLGLVSEPKHEVHGLFGHLCKRHPHARERRARPLALELTQHAAEDLYPSAKLELLRKTEASS